MSNYIDRITSVEQFMTASAFFMEGYQVMKDLAQFHLEDTPDQYVKTVLDAVASSAREDGLVTVLRTGRGQPLAFQVSINNTIRFKPKTVFVYAHYSNNKCPQATKLLMKHGEEWARAQGYSAVLGGTHRVSGASRRWFEKRLGFELYAVIYRKML